MGVERYIRYENDALETAIRTYVLEDKNLTIDLVGVIHIADDKYYKDVKRVLNKEDMVVYEAVGLFPKSDLRIFKVMKIIMAELMYRTPAAFLGLKSQRDGINYEKLPEKWKNVDFRIDDAIKSLEERIRESKEMIGEKNVVKKVTSFINERLPKEEASRMKEELGKIKGFMDEMNRDYPNTVEEAKKLIGTKDNLGNLLEDFVSQNFRLVRALADDVNRNAPEDVKELKKVAAGAMVTYDSIKSLGKFNPVSFLMMHIILDKRNEIVYREIERIVNEEADKRIGIIYGAMHMEGIENCMKGRGFSETGEKWLTAWNCRT